MCIQRQETDTTAHNKISLNSQIQKSFSMYNDVPLRHVNLYFFISEHKLKLMSLTTHLLFILPEY